MGFSLRYFFQQALRKHTDPVVVFPQLRDLQATSEERGWQYEELLPASIQVCPGAHALAEDFLQWVERGPKLLRVHRDSWRGLNFGRHWAAYLHSYRRYPMDKVFRCRIPEATVVSAEGAVLTNRGEYVTEANYIVPALRRSQVSAPRARPKEGRFISLMTVWGEKNMGHFFFDAMLRVAAFERLDEFRFLVPTELQPWHRGLIEVAGIKPHQLVPAEHPFTCVEELAACHIASEGSMPRGELLKRFRDLALSNAVPTPPARRNRRIFIDRSAAKRRKLANQDELQSILADRGFEIVQWERLSMPEQVRLAAETEIMAGPHGTSLLNSIYSQPGAKLLEIINPHWWDAATLRQCALMGHEFWYCFGENASRDHDTRIDPRKLERVLDYMLGAPRIDPPLV
jgi:capsular polysaccharide biosynthesis protein